MKGHFAIIPFPSHRNASKRPYAKRDPYPRPDSSCGTSVWSRTRQLLLADRERAVAPWHSSRLIDGFFRIRPRQPGRAVFVWTKEDKFCGFAVRSAALLFRRGGA